jgi:hypothetical protein
VVVAVAVREAEGAERARARGGGAVEAEHVALAAAVRVAVGLAMREEARGEQRLQPARPLVVVRRRGGLLLRLRAAASLQGRKTQTDGLVGQLPLCSMAKHLCCEEKPKY